jgi:hypothetical protein
MFNELATQWTHRFSETTEETKPVDLSILTKGLLEGLQLIFFNENAIGIESLSNKRLTCSN